MERIEAHKLDEISERLGELGAYIHEHRHSANNLALKFDALGIRISKDIAAMEAKLETKLMILEQRVRQLELDGAKDVGGKHVVTWVLQSPLITWLFAAAAVAWAWFGGKTPK